jgi:beta-mannanase
MSKQFFSSNITRRKSFAKQYFWQVIMAGFALFVFLGHLSASVANPGNTLLGIYYDQGGTNHIANIKSLEDWQGKKNAIVKVFANWCDRPGNLDYLFKDQLLKIWNNQNVPMVSWEPLVCTASPNPTDDEARAATPADIETRIANGEFDAFLNQWAEQMKAFLSGADGVYNTRDDRRAYIRLAHEMNGEWYPWSAARGGNNPGDYVRMWRRVKSLFYNKGMDWKHLQWVWSPNSSDIGGYHAESFYPGDKYVDWVAISGYNWGTSRQGYTWTSPRQIFAPMLQRLRGLTKRPVAISEFATSSLTSSGNNTKAKSQWIGEAFQYALAENIKMVIWFNKDKETDWAAFGGVKGDSTFQLKNTVTNTYSAYRKAVSSRRFISTNSRNPRLLTDSQFAGI